MDGKCNGVRYGTSPIPLSAGIAGKIMVSEKKGDEGGERGVGQQGSREVCRGLPYSRGLGPTSMEKKNFASAGVGILLSARARGGSPKSMGPDRKIAKRR